MSIHVLIQRTFRMGPAYLLQLIALLLLTLIEKKCTGMESKSGEEERPEPQDSASGKSKLIKGTTI